MHTWFGDLIQRIISTRRGSCGDLCSAPVSPIGTWELKFAPSARPLLTAGLIEDILLVVTEKGRLPAWPSY